MDSVIDLEKRVSILEVEMNWATGTVQDIKKDLEILKNSQFQLLDKISSLQNETFDRISALQTHTDERFTALQTHTDERFINVHSKFADVHAEFANVHKEIAGIHKAISGQTKWLLTIILAAAVIVSILHPLMVTLIQK